MASEQDDDAGYAQIAGEESSETEDGRDDEMGEDLEEDDGNSPSTSSPTAISVIRAPSTTASASASAAVTVAVPSSSGVSFSAISVNPEPERYRMPEIAQKPLADESRRLFQRLWTDEDEIELLRGFLDYRTSHQRGGGNCYHHDTAAFYEQIKSKLQLDFNKNQLVEKLRRLKKKYRNAVSKINLGKEISFKSPHDQATFEISRKIWNDTGKIIGFEDNMLDDDQNHNHDVTVTATTATTTTTTTASSNFRLPHCSNPSFEVKIEDGGERRVETSSGNRSRKRSRSKLGRIEDERRFLSDGIGSNLNNVEISRGGNDGSSGGGNVAAAVEETLRSCLSPMLSEFMKATTAMIMTSGSPCAGSRGLGSCSPTMILPSLVSNLHPFGFMGMVGSSSSEVGERWRKQQILELEVYSRRLELVQDQIRLALAELRAATGGSGCGGG